MIERVARILFDIDYPNAVEVDEIFWDEKCDYYRADARRIIEAMREPTKAMTEAGEQADLPGGQFGGEHFRGSSVMGDDAAAVWRAMIDAALKEG